MFQILTAKKSFGDSWIGHPALNRHGLHAKRMRFAARCAAIRRAQISDRGDPAVADLRREGYAVVENFLPQTEFEILLKEAEAAAVAAEAATPIGTNTKPGFGRRETFPWGFQRFDGGTLNRFVKIDPHATPVCAAFARNERLKHIVRGGVGIRPSPRAMHIYTTVHGDETANPDIQKDLHRDTYFSNLKFWYYLHPAPLEDGPLVYVPRSHKLTAERLDWEQAQALAAIERIRGRDRRARNEDDKGSFRIAERDLASIGLPPPKPLPVAGNTLVIADTLGFHRRGDSRPGARRLAIYGIKRPWPYHLLAR